MIAAGHRPQDAWNYTPRQLTAFMFIAEQRRKVERAEALRVGMLAARGDPKDVKTQLKEWAK